MNVKSLIPSLWGRSESNIPDPFFSLRQEIDRVFDQFGRSSLDLPWFRGVAFPKINVTEKDKMIEITAELPGVDLKDVELLTDGDVLTIKGEKRREKEEQGHQRHLYECSYGSFERSIQLPFEVVEKDVDAKFKNGVLTVAIPVPGSAKADVKKIEVKAAA